MQSVVVYITGEWKWRYAAYQREVPGTGDDPVTSCFSDKQRADRPGAFGAAEPQMTHSIVKLSQVTAPLAT